MTKYEIVIDYKDWYMFFTEEGVEIKDKDDVAELSETYTTGEIAQMLLAGREQSEVDEKLLPGTNKWLLLSGARARVNAMLASRKARPELENGKKITIRERVGEPANGKDRGGGLYYRWDDSRAVNLLDEYIFNNAVGQVVGRLRQLAPIVGKEGVRERLESFKEMVDEAVEEIFEMEPTTR